MVDIHKALSKPCAEKNPRCGSLQPEWLVHRFPIKGGVRLIDIMARRNPFLEYMMKGKPK